MKHTMFIYEEGKFKYADEESIVRPNIFKKLDMYEIDTTLRIAVKECNDIVDRLDKNAVKNMFRPIINSGGIRLIDGDNSDLYLYFHIKENDDCLICTFCKHTKGYTMWNYESHVIFNINDAQDLYEVIKSFNSKSITDFFKNSCIKKYGKNYSGMSKETYSLHNANDYVSYDISGAIINILWFFYINLSSNEAIANRSVTYVGSKGRTYHHTNNPGKEIDYDSRTEVHLGDSIKVYVNDKETFARTIKTRSLSCSFNVCGHWRYYRNKDGSVRKKVWVNSFVKGKGKPFKAKTYILPGEEKGA